MIEKELLKVRGGLRKIEKERMKREREKKINR